MAGIGDYEKGKPFQLKSGNKTSFKSMGSSPVQQQKHFTYTERPRTDSPADLNIGDLFKKVHGALTGTEGKRFKDTKFGQAIHRGKEQIQENISDDVKGNLLENVGTAVFNPETDVEESDVSSDISGDVGGSEGGTDYSGMGKNELTNIRKKMREEGTWVNPKRNATDQASIDLQNAINKAYGSEVQYTLQE